MFLFPDVRGEIVRRVGRIIRLEIAFTWFSFLYNNLLASHGGSGKTLSNLISSKNCGASTKFHNIRTLWICDSLSLTKHGELSQVNFWKCFFSKIFIYSLVWQVSIIRWRKNFWNIASKMSEQQQLGFWSRWRREEKERPPSRSGKTSWLGAEMLWKCLRCAVWWSTDQYIELTSDVND